MQIYLSLWIATIIIKISESCSTDFCSLTKKNLLEELPDVKAVLLVKIPNGCTCREYLEHYAFCVGRASCRVLPRNLNISTNAFWLKSTRIHEIKAGDMDISFYHIETMKIEGNDQLFRIATNSFINMTSLKNLNITHNPKLEILEKGCFNGLINLEQLSLNKNGFRKLSAVTAALTQLPKLMNLDLSKNFFSKIKKSDFEVLYNSSLKELSLNLCQIEEIASSVFNPLTNLTVLKLGHNYINGTAMAKLIEATANRVPLKTLDLLSVGLRKTTINQVLEAISKTNISTLSLARNQIDVISSKTFPKMPHLQVLNLSEMLEILNITDDAFINIPNLKTLILKGNKFASIPEGVMLNQLSHLDLQQNSDDQSFLNYFFISKNTFKNMTNLKELNLSFNGIRSTLNTTFAGLQNLEVLALRNASIYHIDIDTFSMLFHLKCLDLQNNPFLKNYPLTLEKGLFKGLVNLQTLLLGGCGISYFAKNSSAFKDLKNLQYLDLQRNHLITPTSFDLFSNLKCIDLFSNNLQPWNEPIFDKNLVLKQVRIGSNKLSYLTESMIQDLEALQSLDLSNNPFTCDCSFSWNTEKIMALIENQETRCAFPLKVINLKVQEFLGIGMACENLTLVITLVSLLVLLTLGLILLFYFRWHVRYWIFLTRLHLSRNHKIKSSLSGHTNYSYDAFVSYSNEDRNFVIRLVTMLENYSPFIKLCVYERDFEVGTMISENILESVAKSRKTVLIISNSYIKSQWCRWESQIVEHHRLFLRNEYGDYVDDSLILIKLGPVSEAFMTPTLKFLLKTRIYLQWDPEEKKQKVFWEKLRTALAPPKEINENTYM